MPINREPIAAALFAKLAAVPGLVTTGRRMKHWNDVPAPMQPALFQQETSQAAQYTIGQPTVWRLHYDVAVYARTDGGLVPGTIVNPLLDAIEAALAGPFEGMPQTLGGLVTACYIDGTIETDEGTLGDQLVALIPITILV